MLLGLFGSDVIIEGQEGRKAGMQECRMEKTGMKGRNGRKGKVR